MTRIHTLQGLRGVRQADLPGEVIAGVTLAALAIPLNIGYAQVANLPPILGLYAALAPLLVFAVFASSRQLVNGPDAPIAALIGSLLLAQAAPDEPRYVQLAFGLALMCAVVFFGLWFFRLGFLANFLSRAVLVGFVSGLGVEVFTSQIPKILGIHIEGEEWLQKVVGIIQGLPETNPYALVVGVGTVVIIRVLKKVAPAVPGALTALVLMTIAVAIFGLEQRGVSLLGSIPSGLPHLTFPQIGPLDYLRLIPGAVAVCGITLAEGLLVGRDYAQRRGYPIDPDQEMFAFGASNVAAGLTGAFVAGSSSSRTAAMDGVGARSQVPSLVAAGVVALVLLFFSSLLALLPNAALGGIVANAVLALIEVEGLRELYRLRRSEFGIAVVCLASVLLLGTIAAVVIAFLLSVVEVVRRAAAPATRVMDTVPGVVVYRFGAELFFGNASTFSNEVHRAADATRPLEWFVLDAEAISDIDTTGAETLEHTVDFLHERGVTFAVSRAEPEVVELLRHYDLLERIGEQHVFDTNREAVAAYGATHTTSYTPSRDEQGVSTGRA